MKQKAILLLFIVALILLNSFSIILFSQNYYPISSGEFIDHIDSALSYNEDHEQANWVYYRLSKKQVLNGNVERTDDFREDYKVSSGSATLKDYKNSGYDRGHLCPAADMKMFRSSMSKSFLLSNMSPQNPSFNRGIWKKLESQIRIIAINEELIHIVTGPIFKNNKGTIGKNNVTVPGYYYKVIYDPTGSQKMVGLILPNEKGTKKLPEYIVTVDSIEALTNIDFFSELADSIEFFLESQNTRGLWGFESSKSNTDSNAIAKSSNSSKSSISTVNQCIAIAKTTGNQCKRMTTNSNGYCWQHQDQVGNSTSYTKPKTSNNTDRCQAKAKSTGLQCKRKAEPGSRYCWQHK